MVDFRRSVSKQTGAVGQGRRERSGSHQKANRRKHTVSTQQLAGLKVALLIPIPSHEATWEKWISLTLFKKKNFSLCGCLKSTSLKCTLCFSHASPW